MCVESSAATFLLNDVTDPRTSPPQSQDMPRRSPIGSSDRARVPAASTGPAPAAGCAAPGGAGGSPPGPVRPRTVALAAIAFGPGPYRYAVAPAPPAHAPATPGGHYGPRPA